MIAGADNPGSLGTAASASAMGSSRIYSNAGEKNQFPTSAVAFPGPQSASPANNLKPSSEAEEPAFKPTNQHLLRHAYRKRPITRSQSGVAHTLHLLPGKREWQSLA
jgi:hypothetical protein